MKSKQAKRTRAFLKYTADELAQWKHLRRLIKQGKLPRYQVKLIKGIRQRGYLIHTNEKGEKVYYPQMRGLELRLVDTIASILKGNTK